MLDADPIARFQQRLVELGCPAACVRRSVQELGEHYDDLKAAAREEGLSEAAAEARAAERLGEPVALAEHVAAVLRNSSWWGRHPVIGFCILPPVGILAIAVLGLLLVGAIANFYLSDDELRLLSDDELGLKSLRTAMVCIYYAAIALTSGLFCRLAKRSGCGLKWALAACAVCLLHSSVFSLGVRPHTLWVGYNYPYGRDAIAIGIPLLTGAALWLRQRQAAKALATAPESGRPDPRARV